MAEVVAHMPARSGSRPRQPGKYTPYLDGRVWKLELGVDCPSVATVARDSISQAAHRRGLRIRTRVLDGALYVQAHRPRPRATRAASVPSPGRARRWLRLWRGQRRSPAIGEGASLAR